MLRDLELTLDAVGGWLALGRDVVIRGDDGSGRSTVLRALADRLSARGERVLLLRAAGPRDHAALLAHPSFPPALAHGSSIELVRWLVEELSGPRATLLIDDVHQLDPGTAEAVQQALVQTGAAFVLTAGGLRVEPAATPFIAAMITARAPADVRVRPMGYTSLSGLIAERLGAPSDVPLLASVAARSAGNPRVATALADAARYAGAIELRDGRWHTAAAVNRVPLDAVVNAFVPRLSAAELDALEVLSWTGPVPLDEVDRMLEPTVVRALFERGRLVSSPDLHGVPSVVVSPPALASALRSELSAHRRVEIAERAGAVDPRFRQSEPVRGSVLDTLLTPQPDEVGEGAHWIAALAAQIEEHDVARESAARAAWLARPSVRTALAYLTLLSRRPAHEECAEVYRQTPLSPQDDPMDRALFRMQHLFWVQWSGLSRQVADELAEQHADDLAPLTEMNRVRDLVRERASAGLPLETVLSEPVLAGDDAMAGLSIAVLSGALLEAGRPDLALPLAERGDLAEQPTVVAHLLAGLRASSLLMLGEWDEVERQTRGLFEAACADLDAAGIRVHGCVLAEALFLSGRTEQAWTAVSTVLRFGISGPNEDPFFRRGLALAVSIRARLGDLDTAEELLAELRSLPTRYRPPIDSLLPLAETAVARLRGDSPTVDEELWTEGLRLVEIGQVGTALECWLLRPRAYTAEQMRVIEQHFDRVTMPMLLPWYRMHRALTEGEPAAIRAALAELPREAALGLYAARVLGGSAPTCAPAPLRRTLSEREQAVAELVSHGKSDREIADELFLSLTTTQLHLRTVLDKLGLAERCDLARSVGA